MDFILNEEIAKDMYPDLEGMLLDLVKSLCSMLDYYKVYNKEKTIFSGVIHDNGEAEVTLSKGLGKYIDPYTKNQIILIMANLHYRHGPSFSGSSMKR